MTQSDAPDTPGINLGSLTADVVFNLDEAQLKRTLDAAEARLGKKIEIPVLVGGNAVPALRDLRAELDRVSGQTTKVSREQAAASRSLEAQYRAAGQAQVQAARVSAAESAAAAAKIREQAAAYTLQARMAAQAASAEKRRNQDGIQGLSNEVRAYRNLWQSRIINDEEAVQAQTRLRQRALEMASALDRQSDAYRQLTTIAAGAQRTIDAAQGVNTPGGFGYGISQGITNAFGQFGVGGDLLAGFVQLIQSKRAAATKAATDLGEDTMAGLTLGVKVNSAKAAGEADTAAAKVIEAVRRTLDIHSPSRVMEYLGRMAGLGFVTGLKSQADDAARAAAALSAAAANGVNVTPNGAALATAFGGDALQALNPARINQTTAALAGLNAETKDGAAAAASNATEQAVAGAAIEGVGEAVGGAAEKVKELSDARKESNAAGDQTAVNEARAALAFTATAAALGAVAVAAVASFNAAADYEAAMKKAAATTGATNTELERLSVTARSPELVQLGVSGSKAAEGIAELGGAGLNTAQILDGGLVNSIKLSKAVGADLATAGSVGAASLKAFNLEAKDLGKVADVITTAVNSTSIKIGDFTNALAAGGSTAKQAGVNFTTFTAAVSLMTDKAIGASDAGTSLKTFFGALTPNTKEAARIMKELGFNAFTATGQFKPFTQIVEELRQAFSKLTPEQRASKAETVFGSDAIRAFNILVDAGGEGLQNRIRLLDSMGAADQAAAGKLSGVRGEQEKFNASLENFKIAAGTSFLPAAARMLDWATKFVSEGLTPILGKLNDINKELGDAKTPADIRATLTITAGDDGTTQVLKLLAGGVQVIKSGLFTPAPGQRTAPDVLGDFVRQLSVSALQKQLQEAGLIDRKPYAFGGAAQAREIAANLAKYQQMLADYVAASLEAGRKITSGLTAQPKVAANLTGEGPLLPGQQRAVQQATDGIVQALGMAGKRVLNEFGVSGKDYHHDGAVRADATHNGIDFGAPRGTPILAPFAGQISTRQDARNGKVFELVDALGNKLVGIHLEQFDAGVQEALRKGGGKALILRGQQIGTVGNTGTTAGSAPHLHLMGYRAGSSTPVDARTIGYAGLDGSVRPASTNTTRTATTFVKKTDQALIAEARRILDRIEAATKAGDVTGKVKAEAVLKAFTDSGPRAAAALEIVRGEAKATRKEVSQYGQTFDKLKGQLDLAGSTFKLSDDAQGYARSLDAISKAAQTAASSEKAKNGETAKYRALLDLAGDAAGKARQQREGDDRAAQQASDKAKARAKEQAQLRARYAAQARDLEVSEQQATLARVRTLNSAELDAFKGTQAQRVALIKRQAADEANAREQVARAVRDKTIREAQNAGGPNMGTAIEQARQAYTDEVQAARLAQQAANRAALAGEAQAVRQVRDAYGELATGLREKIRAGQVDEEALAAYRTRVDELATSARAAGVAGSRFVTGAQASAQAVYQLAIDAQVASGAYDNVGDSYDRATRAGQGYTVTLKRALELLPDGEAATDAYVRALEDLATQGAVSADTLNAVRQAIADRAAIWQLEAEQIARVTTEGLGAADALAQVGDTEGAIDTLYGTLDDLYTRLEDGEDVAAAIAQVTDRLTDLGSALELDAEFGTFVAGLGGMIDDQIAQLVDKIADPATNAKLAAKLKVFLADLRGQLPRYADPYAAGLIPGGNGFAPQVQDGADLDTITRARDLGTLIAETTDPAALQGVIAEVTDLLASEAGKKLSEGTRQGLEDGVKDAQEYLNILGGLTEEAVVDGWERGTRGALANPTPTNEFTTWAQKIFDLGAAGLNDPTTFDGLTQSLDAARASGELTIADLQNLLALIEQLKTASDNVDLGPIGRMTGNYDGLLTRGVGIEQARAAGELDPVDATTQLRGLAKEAERYAAAAQAAGDTELAGQFRQIAAGAREAAGAMGKLMAAQEVLDWTAQLSGAFGDLAGALGEVEQEYDGVTGEKLSTPWKDLAANLDGVQNAAKKLGSMITDVVKLLANPADIGAWVSLITNVVSSIADAIAGFQRAQAEVTRLKQEFAQDNPLLNPGDYQKAYSRSRGFLADVFGGGPEVVNEIDKIGVMFAKTLQDALIGGIKTGMVEAIKQNDFSLFKSTLRESTFDGLLSGMVDAFLKDEILKSILAPAIKAWSDALKTPDTADDAAALAGIDAAISQADQRAERFYTDVAPKFMDLQQRWGIDPAQSGGASGSRPVFGNAPDVQYGAPPRVLFPPEALLGFTAFGQAVPEWRAGVAEWRQINAEFRQTVVDLSRSRPGGLQPLSGGTL